MKTIPRRSIAAQIQADALRQAKAAAELPKIAEKLEARLLAFSGTEACLLVNTPAKVIATFYAISDLYEMANGHKRQPLFSVHRDAIHTEEFEAACKHLIEIRA